MPNEDQAFKFSTRCDQAQTADYLEQVAKHIRNGHLQLSAGTESIGLTVAGEIKLEIAAESSPEKGKNSLRLELSWDAPIPPKEDPHIRIEGSAPADASTGGNRASESDSTD